MDLMTNSIHLLNKTMLKLSHIQLNILQRSSKEDQINPSKREDTIIKDIVVDKC